MHLPQRVDDLAGYLVRSGLGGTVDRVHLLPVYRAARDGTAEHWFLLLRLPRDVRSHLRCVGGGRPGGARG